MNKYELGLVIHPSLDEEALKAEHAVILDYVLKSGGVVEKTDDWGKRRLAYEINKQTEGHYCFITIDAPPTMPKEVESRLRIRENVLRFLIIRKDVA
ncbi:MAG: 30S ribosomal protein S6 [Defluviitaleaceae bacterium]|nr:30S ribosomal protein S6 [Defluviitaleaceae bacterium]